MKEIDRLIDIMKKLRDKENGCPWDLKQNHQTLKQYVLEETYEVIDAIDYGDDNDLKKELGDLLLQIVFHTQIASEGEKFDFDDVAKGISDKLVRRHPHIFSDKKEITPEEVQSNWEMIKKEKEGKKRILDGVPRSYNALLRSLRIQQKVASVGFEWGDVFGITDKIKEETAELCSAIENGDDKNAEEEIGDLMFVLVNLSKRLNINPEDALQKANNKFIERFNYIEEKVTKNGAEVKDKTLEELDTIWDEAKKVLKKTS